MNGRFRVGQRVRIKTLFPPGHVRAPFFTRGKRGEVAALLGSFGNPEDLAYGRYDGPRVPLYRVRFRQRELWPDYGEHPDDTLVADVYEHWLEPEETAR